MSFSLNVDGISIKGDQGDRGHDGVGHDGKQVAAASIADTVIPSS